MAQEIERKFLIHREKIDLTEVNATRIVQGFLNSDKNRTVRVRIKGKNGFLTVKGLSKNKGLSRFEWEKQISIKEAEELLGLCEPGVIEKNRYEINHEGFVFEIDEFFGENEGLWLAELELEHENQSYSSPGWLSTEVTGDERFYNAVLSKNPYKSWKK